MKRPNQHITGIEEEEIHIKSTENIFDKHRRRKFPLTEMGDTYLVTRRAQNIKKTGPEKKLHTTIKTLNTQTKKQY